MLFISIVFQSFILTCPQSVTPKEVDTEVVNLFGANEFEKLEAFAKCIKTNKIRFDSGDWALERFYLALESDLDTDSKFVSKIDSYKKLFPKSAIPFVFESIAHRKLAWKRRGTGYAADVSKKAFQDFFENLRLGWNLLLKAKEKDENDPQILTELIKIGYPAEMPLPEIGKIFKLGTQVQNNYYPLYYIHAEYLLPKWNGKSDKDVEAFAQMAAGMTKDTEGNGLYAKIAAEFAKNYKAKVLKEYEFKWEKIKSGFEDISKKFPNSDFNLTAFTYFSAIAKDKKAAAILFAKIDEQWSENKKLFFNSPLAFQSYKNWALKDAPYPGESELHAAIKEKNIPLALRLIETGADINLLDPASGTPLLLSIENSLSSVTQALLKKGADPKLGFLKGMTALHYAVEKGDSAAVQAILATGMSPNTLDSSEWTALHRAGARNKVEIIDILVSNPETDPNIKTPDGRTSLIMAISMNYDEAVERLLKSKKIDVNMPRKDNWAPLHIAAWYGNEKIVRHLIKAGASKISKSGNGLNAEQVANSKNFPSVAAVIRELN